MEQEELEELARLKYTYTQSPSVKKGYPYAIYEQDGKQRRVIAQVKTKEDLDFFMDCLVQKFILQITEAING